MRLSAWSLLAVSLAACFPDPLPPTGEAAGLAGGGGRSGAGSGVGGSSSAVGGTGAVAGASGIAGAPGGSGGGGAGIAGAAAGKAGASPAGGGGGTAGSSGASGGTAGAAGANGGIGGASAGIGGTSAGAAGESAGSAGSGEAGASGANAGTAGTTADAGAGGAAGDGGAAGAGQGGSGGLPTYDAPGKLDCLAPGVPDAFALCTNISPPPAAWSGAGCWSQVSESGNDILQWKATAGSKCTSFMDTGFGGKPDEVLASMWFRADKLDFYQSEPASPFLRAVLGDIEASLAIRAERNGLGVVEGATLVLKTNLPDVDLGPVVLGEWQHVRLRVLGSGGVVGSVGGTTTTTTASQTLQPGGVAGQAKVSLLFQQTQYNAGLVALSLDDFTVAFAFPQGSCGRDADCLSESEKRRCSPPTGLCVECRVSADCTTPGKPTCDTVKAICVP